MGNYITGERINRKEYSKIEDKNEGDTGSGKGGENRKGGENGKGGKGRENGGDSIRRRNSNPWR
jgi:hypothetical protein